MQKLLSFVLISAFLFTQAVLASELPESLIKGNELATEKKYEEAAKQYELALKEQPQNVLIHLLLGLNYANLGNFEPAIKHAKKAAELDPSYNSFYPLGLIYGKANNYPKAIESFDKALALNPSSFMAEYQKGIVCTAQENYTEAISSYERALKLNPEFTDARLALAGAHLKKGDTTSALLQVEELKKMRQDTLAEALNERIKEQKS